MGSWVSQGRGCSRGKQQPLAWPRLLEVLVAVEGTMGHMVGGGGDISPSSPDRVDFLGSSRHFEEAIIWATMTTFSL